MPKKATMKNHPLASIITVVRNDKSGLSRTIKSALAQKETDWELLIKDGNSQDGTFELADKFANQHKNIKLVSGSDKNLYDAMNMALSEACGVYLIFLNAGDEFETVDSLEMALANIENNRDCDIGFFSTRVHLQNGTEYTRQSRPPEYIAYGQPGIHQSTIIRREFHESFKYDFKNYPNIADYVSVARMIQVGAKSASFNQILARFEITQSSSSFRNQRSVRHEFDAAIREIWKPSRTKRLYFMVRRWFSMMIIRILMKVR